MTKVFSKNKNDFYDDYAHHPTEIENVLDGVNKSFKNKKVTGFTTVPHNYKDFDLVEISGITSSVYKNIEGFRTVGVVTSKTNLTVALGNTAATGINTSIRLQEPTGSRKFTRNNIIKIGNEEMLITIVDDLNNKYNVVRKHNNVESAHVVDSEVNKLTQEFTFDVKQQLKNKNIEKNLR